MQKAIGIFDSGIGGLTVLKEIVAALPDENIIYLGDTARVPYGIRSAETVTRYSFARIVPCNLICVYRNFHNIVVCSWRALL